MRSANAACNAAPSTTLLRFLRAQSELYFFSPNSPRIPLGYCAPKNAPGTRPSLFLSKRLSTIPPCRASIQALGMESWTPISRDSWSPLPLTITTTTRHASTSFLRRIMHLKQFRIKDALRPSDVPDRNADLNYDSQFLNLTRSIARSGGGAETKLRCTEFDASGAVTLVSGEFKKSELIAKYGLLPRDLRKIDSSLLPHILVRKSAILLNLLHLRVLIQADRVLVFDAYGTTDSYTQSLFMYDLEGKLRQKTDQRASTYLPYEFRALEAVLVSVTSGLESEFEGVRGPVVRVLRELEEDIDRDKLRNLLVHSKKLGSFEQKARLVRDAISDLLDADDDLVAMYLTENAHGKPRQEDDHQEVEMLLESYHKICDEIVEASGNLITNIRNTEEIVKAILDANRNSLMLLDLKFSIGTLGLAAGTLFAGLYGMNLKNFLEESDHAFSVVSLVCFGLSGIVAVYGMKKLKQVQRLRMWGEGYDTAYRSPTELARQPWKSENCDSARKRQASLAHIRAERMRLMREKGNGRVLWPGMDGLGEDATDNGSSASGPDSSLPKTPVTLDHGSENDQGKKTHPKPDRKSK